MRLLLHDGPFHLQIVPASRLRDFRDTASARDFLAPLLLDPRNLAAVTEALGRIPPDGDVAEELARRVVSGGLLIVPCGEQATGGSAGSKAEETQTTPLQDEEAAAAANEAAVQSDETHFIEIELLDDEGKPIADELYFVELPDGSKVSGRTDASGKARVEGVDPGTAKVTFPDRDKDLYTPQ